MPLLRNVTVVVLVTAIAGVLVGSAGQVPRGVDSKAAPVDETQRAAMPTGRAVEQGDGITELPIIDRAAQLEIEQRTEARIRAALRQPVSAKFRDEPLRSAVAKILEQVGVQFRMDVEAMAEEGLSPEEPVINEFQNVPAAAALHWLFEPLGLTWIVQDEVLVVTTELAASEMLITRAYDVSRVLESISARESCSFCGDWLARHAPEQHWLLDALEEFVPGLWELSNGIGGSARLIGRTLVVRQTFQTHASIDAFLQALEAAATGRLNYGSQTVEEPIFSCPNDAAAYAALDTPVTIDASRMSLAMFLSVLANQVGITMRIDTAALAEEGITLTVPIDLEVHEISLRSALDLAFESHQLDFRVQCGAVMITTEIANVSSLPVVVYDVRDLIQRGFPPGALIDIIQFQTSGPWACCHVGSTGSLELFQPGILVVTQVHPTHREIGRLLAQLREHPEPPKPPAGDDQDLAVWTFNIGVPELAAELVTVVPDVIAPNAWNEQTAIRHVGEMLIVRQTAAVQRQIDCFIGAIGRTMRREADH